MIKSLDRARPIQRDRDDVDAIWAVPWCTSDGASLEIGVGQCDQPLLFGGRDRFLSSATSGTAPSSHLNNHQGRSIDGYQIDLAGPTAPAPLDDLVAVAFKVCGGKRFAPRSQRPASVALHLRH